MEKMVATLLDSPKLLLYYQELREAIERETALRKQFHATMTEQQKVEFVNGEMVHQSPVKIEHEFASGSLYVLLRAYVMQHQLGYVGHEKMLVSLTRNDYEPDVCFWATGKSTTFQRGQMHFPAPDFVAEVLSPSTETTDRTIKLQDYAAHGVLEYWIIEPVLEVVEQYVLQGNAYTLVKKTDSGLLKSVAVAGFCIPVAALFDEHEHLRVLWELGQAVV